VGNNEEKFISNWVESSENVSVAVRKLEEWEELERHSEVIFFGNTKNVCVLLFLFIFF